MIYSARIRWNLDPDPLTVYPEPETDDEPWTVYAELEPVEAISWYVVGVVALALWLGLAVVAMAIVRRR